MKNSRATANKVILVSGCPAAGKTTLAQRIVLDTNTQPSTGSRPVHIHTDDFYTALPDLIDPSLPASKTQNENIVRQFSKVAARLAGDGHSVVVDGVIGPWMLPFVTEWLDQFYYVVLHPSLEQVTARGAARTDQPVSELAIQKMHQAFTEAEPGFERHYLYANHPEITDCWSEERLYGRQ